MAKFRKKPVEIEAVKFTRNNWDEVKSFTNNTAHTLTIERRINGIATLHNSYFGRSTYCNGRRLDYQRCQG